MFQVQRPTAAAQQQAHTRRCNGTTIMQKGAVPEVCGEECQQKISGATSKSPNRAFWVCPIEDKFGGHGFQGWSDQPPPAGRAVRPYLQVMFPTAADGGALAHGDANALMNLANEMAALRAALEQVHGMVQVLYEEHMTASTAATTADSVDHASKRKMPASAPAPPGYAAATAEDYAVDDDPTVEVAAPQPRRAYDNTAATFSLNLPKSGRSGF